MTFDLHARLRHVAELKKLRRQLSIRMSELDAPLLTAAYQWAVAHDVEFCCERAEVQVYACEPIDYTIHFEWGCRGSSTHYGTSSEVFRVPINDLIALLDSPTT